MHTFLKVSVPLILFGIIVIVVVVPVVLHFHKDDGQRSSTNKSEIEFQGIQHIILKTTTTGRSTTSAIQNLANVSSMTTRITSPITNTVRLTSTTGTTSRLTTINGINNMSTNIAQTIQSTYSSNLNTNNGLYCRRRPCAVLYYCYEAIQIDVPVGGNYSIRSSSSMDTYGYIYNDTFYPLFLQKNLLISNDDGGGNSQFLMTMILRPMIRYILVVTTYNLNVSGSYSILVSGPSSVNFARYNLSSPVYSTYSSVLNSNSSMFSREDYRGTTNYYYEAFEINVSTSDYYVIMSNSSIDTYGMLYTNNFKPYFVSTNRQSIDDDSGDNTQFLFETRLENSTKCILVVTTYNASTIGSFSVLVLGSTSVNISRYSVPSPVYSQYSSALNSNSSMFAPAGYSKTMNYYYEAFEINVFTSDYFIITSNSSIDTYGILYTNNFNPYVVKANRNASDDQSGGNNQFLFSVMLQPLTKYILIVTTSNASITGSFSVLVFGSISVNISRYNVPRPVYSQYSSVLNNNSSMFALTVYSKATNYYYAAIEINVSASNYYVITSNSSINTYGILYTNNFDPYLVNTNRQSADDDSGGNNQFLFEIILQPWTKYILVVTTANASTTGAFSVIGYGPSSISFSRFNVTNNLPIVLSEYSSSLTNSSQIYCRYYGTCTSGTYYYYQSFQVNVSVTGYYSIWSNSTIDTYGFIYNNTFNASSVNANLLLSNDEGVGHQFGITILLQAMMRYILVVTTYSSAVTGSFSLIGLGPSSFTFVKT